MSTGRAAGKILARSDAAPAAMGAKAGDLAKPTSNRGRHPLSAAFLSDLRAFWKPEFGPQRASRPPRVFFDDLQRVYEAERTDDSPLRRLKTLGNRLLQLTASPAAREPGCPFLSGAAVRHRAAGCAHWVRARRRTRDRRSALWGLNPRSSGAKSAILLDRRDGAAIHWLPCSHRAG